jgi:hypothetical protein
VVWRRAHAVFQQRRRSAATASSTPGTGAASAPPPPAPSAGPTSEVLALQNRQLRTDLRQQEAYVTLTAAARVHA